MTSPAAAPWLSEVQSGIDSADNFVFILSPDSVVSGPCMEELEYRKDPASPFSGNNAGADSFAWNPDVVAVSNSGAAARLRAHGVEMRRDGRSFMLPDSPPLATQLAISADGRFVAASSTNGNALSRRLWDVSAPTPRMVPLEGEDAGTFALAFSPNRDLLATAGRAACFSGT